MSDDRDSKPDMESLPARSAFAHVPGSWNTEHLIHVHRRAAREWRLLPALRRHLSVLHHVKLQISMAKRLRLYFQHQICTSILDGHQGSGPTFRHTTHQEFQPSLGPTDVSMQHAIEAILAPFTRSHRADAYRAVVS